MDESCDVELIVESVGAGALTPGSGINSYEPDRRFLLGLPDSLSLSLSRSS